MSNDIFLHHIEGPGQKPTHIRLIEGVVKVNPLLKVLCPTLAKREKTCNKGKMKNGGFPYRPELLIKNFGNSSLQLWSCKGCRDKFLLRVIINEMSLL